MPTQRIEIYQKLVITTFESHISHLFFLNILLKHLF